MDPALLSELMKYGIGIAVLGYVAWAQSKKIAESDVRADARATAMQQRCDDERKTLSAEIAKVRDAHSEDQRDLLRAAGTALTENAKAFGKLVEIHERRQP